jgi:hypothetical protein
VPAPTSSAPTPFAAVARDGSRDWRLRRRFNLLSKLSFLLTVVRLAGGFRDLPFRKFGDDRLQSSCWFRSGFVYGCSSKRHGNRRTKAGKSFFRFLFPLCPAKTLGGCGVPAGRFRVRANLLMDLREFKRNHGIACAFVQRRELTWGIRAGSRLADARLNLSPIAH